MSIGGSLSIEARGGAMLRDLGASLQFFSALTGVEYTKLSLGFRQIKAFSSQDSLKISQTLFRLIEVRSALSSPPFSLLELFMLLPPAASTGCR